MKGGEKVPLFLKFLILESALIKLNQIKNQYLHIF